MWIIGVLMMVAIILAVIALMAHVTGWKEALIIFAIAIVGTIWVVIAAFLMCW